MTSNKREMQFEEDVGRRLGHSQMVNPVLRARNSTIGEPYEYSGSPRHSNQGSPRRSQSSPVSEMPQSPRNRQLTPLRHTPNNESRTTTNNAEPLNESTSTTHSANGGKVLFGFTRKQLASIMAFVTTIITLVSANIGVTLNNANKGGGVSVDPYHLGVLASVGTAVAVASSANTTSVPQLVCQLIKALHNLTNMTCNP